MKHITDIAFSETVKDIQSRKGSRETYARIAEKNTWTDQLNDDLKTYIENQRSAYLGTVNRDGQPYIQHRGGPAGFLRVLDEKTIAFADFKGNQQFISQGNLLDNPKAFLFLMDYSTSTRVKFWGEARVIEDDEDLLQQLMPDKLKALPEQIIIFTVTLWNFNCHQHIPVLLSKEQIAHEIKSRDQKIMDLEARIQQLQNRHQ